MPFHYSSTPGSSATEPFARGQSLGPIGASPLMGLAALIVSAGLFHGLRTCAAGLGVVGVASCSPMLVVAAVGLLLAAVLPERERSPVADR